MHFLFFKQLFLGTMKLSPWCLALLSFANSNYEAASFIPLSKSGRTSSTTWSLSATPTTTEEQTQTLSTLFGSLASSLDKLGYSTPTPIQRSSAVQALDLQNLLLIAPTGSGKTLAYLLPALTRAIQQDGTFLVVAPTRELAVQLLRDTTSLISNLDGELAQTSVVLAVRGVDVPTPEALNLATVLIGTPLELLQVLTQVQGGQDFVAGDVIGTVILDEVDVLLPLPPKTLRTALDNDVADKAGKKSNGPQDERRRQEQRRKLMSAKRQGTEVSTTTKQVVSPTEKLLGLIASRRFAGGDGATPCQILAGSATASRKTLDRLNKAVRFAAQEAPGTIEVVWGGDMIACRPEELEIESAAATVSLPDGNDDDDDDDEWTPPQAQQHTIRAVTVPQQVQHRFVLMEKEAANSPRAVLSAVAKAAKTLKPKTALVFLCGDFAKAPTAEIKKVVSTPNKNGRKKTLTLKEKRLAASAVSRAKTEAKIVTLSARKACSTLAEFGIEAKPLHVALGLELNAKDDDPDAEDTPPFLVTFEGSARGLHFDGVDAIFCVGRPTSAASYLHLAGRVGRSAVSPDGSITIRPGTVVSLCTKGSATELRKWTKQIGGTELEELAVE